MKKAKMLVISLRARARKVYHFFDDLFHFTIRTTFGLLIIERFLVYVRTMNKPITISKPRVEVTIRKATLTDMHRFVESMPWMVPSDIKLYSRRLKNSRICFIALDKERIVSYSWLSFEFSRLLDGSDLHPPVMLRCGWAYGYDAYTLPEYRRAGLARALSNSKLEYCRKKGYERAVSLVSERNIASRRMVEKGGARPFKKIKFIKIFGFQRWRYENINETLFAQKEKS